MKYILKYIITFLSVVAYFGCTEDVKYTIKLESSSENVTLTEDAKEARVEIPATGGSAEITVKASHEWTVVEEEGADWYTLVVEKEKITISSNIFISNYDRQTLIRLMLADGTIASIFVNQDGTNKASLELKPSGPIKFPDMGGVKEVIVKTNKTWDVTGYEELDWLNVVINENSFELNAHKINNTEEDFTATLTVTAGEGENSISKTLDVIVEKVSLATIVPSLTEIITLGDGGTYAVTMKTNRDWEITSEEVSWFSATKNENTLNIVIDENSGEKRSASIEISTISVGGIDEIAKVEIIITQHTEGFELEYTTTEENTTIYAPVYGNINCIISWGDGAITSHIENVNNISKVPSHTYAEAGVYKVTIMGNADRLSHQEIPAEASKCLTSIVKWHDLGFNSLNNGFENTSIKSITTGYDKIISKANITITSLFKNCTELESVPEDLFCANNTITSLMSVFEGCKKLTTVPEGLLTGLNKVNQLTSLFKNTGLTSVPESLLNNCTLVTIVSSIFSGCKFTTIPGKIFEKNTEISAAISAFEGSSLTTIPADLFASNTKVITFMSAFKGCTGLTSIPETLFATNTTVANFNSTFEGCTSISSVPELLFEKNTNASAFSSTFSGCTALTSIPDNLFATNTKAAGFMKAFSGCSELTSIPATLFANNVAVTTFSETFSGCSKITSIPVGLFDNCKKATNFGSTFKGCTALTGSSPYTEIESVKYHLWERQNNTTVFAKPTVFADCFDGCSGLTDYNTIPEDWK